MKKTHYPYILSLSLFFDDFNEAKILSEAIKPELLLPHSKRCIPKIILKKNMLSMNICSLDAVALRATFSSLLKKIILAKSILEVK